MRNLFKLILILVLLSGVLGAGYYFLLFKPDKTGNTLVDNTFGWKYPIAKFPLAGPEGSLIAYSSIRDPGGIAQGLPMRLKIPVIGVDSAIEDALITPDGRMDVPAGSVNVAWFALGPYPGRVGSAVIGGHFGIDSGVPKVFYNLDKLRVGDKVYVTDDKGDTLAFQVSSIKLFNRNDDATTVFTSGDGLAHLNLITCEGLWNQVNDSYPKRRVVFTNAISSEGAVVVKPSLVAARAKLPATAAPVVPTATPSALLSSVPSSQRLPSSLPQIFIASTRAFYATPIDGLITSVLILSIIFVGFKVIRRQ